MGHSHWDIDGTFLKDLFCKCPTGKGSRFQRWRGLRSRYAYLCSVGHGTQTQNFVAGETPRARNARGTVPPLEGPKMLTGGIIRHVNDFVSFPTIFFTLLTWPSSMPQRSPRSFHRVTGPPPSGSQARNNPALAMPPEHHQTSPAALALAVSGAAYVYRS